MNIKTKLSIGDNIFIIWRNTNTVYEACSVCNGSTKVVINNKNYECPECYGNGNKTIYEPQCWRLANSDNLPVPTSKVRKINIEIIKKKIDITYYPWGESGNYFYEKDCFATLKEAENECIKRNKEDIEKRRLINETT